ncbi:MAG: aminobutyraldehyde dehydrogenase [Actinobacteria bacterium]|nr:aminobutyraldehyde dehydrogenase [Actinomycetota bacterium]
MPSTPPFEPLGGQSSTPPTVVPGHPAPAGSQPSAPLAVHAGRPAPPGLLGLAHSRLANLPLAPFIGGRFRPDLPSANILVINPATGDPLCEAPAADAAAVDEAVRAAQAAAGPWRCTPPVERARTLLSLADIIDDHGELFAQLESLNTGKPLMVSREEIPLASDALRFMAGACRTAQAPAAGEYAPGQLSVIRREPVGVVGAITPWNFPLMMAVWKIAPALAAGNTVVLKPSELTPLTTLLFADQSAAVLPAGVLNVLLGTGPVVGEAMTRHPGIAMICLTGSVPTGQAVALGAAQTLKRVHLELGGKAPVLVYPDADLRDVTETVRLAGFWNSGQECGSATRVLCHQEVAEELTARLESAVSTISVGDPAEGEDVEMGPLISARQLGRVDELIRGAERDGAQVILGGAPAGRAGFYYQPTMITGIRRGSEIVTHEIFGPVVTVQTFATEAESVEMANDVPYGLAASAWTKDTDRALRVSDALDFGTVWVNSHLTLTAEMPWGGFGLSGHGRDMSTYALDDYTRTKHVMLRTGE